MDYKAELAHVNENNQRIFHQTPDVARSFMDMYQKAGADRALDAKTKALIALGISISVRCEGCIAMHVASAVEKGATMADIADVVDVALMMGGGPAMVHGGKALECAEQMLAK